MTRTTWLGVLMLFAAACRPDYPKCKKDDHCKPGEFCVQGLCQQCRDAADCKRGESCNQGRCERTPGWCETAADCPAGQACKDNRCGACAGDADCGPGGRCRAGTCLTAGACASDDDCAAGQECQGGRCVAPPTPLGRKGPCELQPVYFDFNESLLTADAQATLTADADCLKRGADLPVRLEGHCDPRGTEEYNLALGDRRARAVADHLSRLGVARTRLRPVARGKIDAQGTDESGWKRDRRVELIWE